MIVLLILGIIIIALIIKQFVSKPPEDDTTRPTSSKKPVEKKFNNKIIIVSNMTYIDIQAALIKFCNLYNKTEYVALPRLTEISSNCYAITFPYDVDFATFCYAVNFLKYSINTPSNPKVTAWATTKKNDKWITNKSADKNIMLYIDDNDKEYDNVFLTTQDNFGYKLDFSFKKEPHILSTPLKRYLSPKIDIVNLDGLKFRDFE